MNADFLGAVVILVIMTSSSELVATLLGEVAGGTFIFLTVEADMFSVLGLTWPGVDPTEELLALPAKLVRGNEGNVLLSVQTSVTDLA